MVVYMSLILFPMSSRAVGSRREETRLRNVTWQQRGPKRPKKNNEARETSLIQYVQSACTGRKWLAFFFKEDYFE
jgi:hypothetical protein